MFTCKDYRLQERIQMNMEAAFWLNIRAADPLDYVGVAINLPYLYGGGTSHFWKLLDREVRKAIESR